MILNKHSLLGVTAILLLLTGCNSESLQQAPNAWVATDVSLQGVAQDTLTIDVTQLVGDDSESALSLTQVSGAQHGHARIENNYVFYDANPNYVGPDDFSITLSDGEQTQTVVARVDIGQRLTFSGAVSHGDFQDGTVSIVGTEFSAPIDAQGRYQLHAEFYLQDIRQLPTLYAQSSRNPEVALSSRLPEVQSLFDLHFTHGLIHRDIEHNVQLTPLSTAQDILIQHYLDEQVATAKTVRQAARNIDVQVYLEMGAVAALLTQHPEDIVNSGFTSLHSYLSDIDAYQRLVEALNTESNNAQNPLALAIEDLLTNDAVTMNLAPENFIGEFLNETETAAFVPSNTFEDINVTQSTLALSQGAFDQPDMRGRFPRYRYSYTLNGSTLQLTPADDDAFIRTTQFTSPVSYLTDPQVIADYNARFEGQFIEIEVSQSYKEFRIISTLGDYLIMRAVTRRDYPETTLTDQFGQFVLPATTRYNVSNQRWINKDSIQVSETPFTDVAESTWFLPDFLGFFTQGTLFNLNADNTVTLVDTENLHWYGSAYYLLVEGYTADWQLLEDNTKLEITFRYPNDEIFTRVQFQWIDDREGYWSGIATYTNTFDEEYTRLHQIVPLPETNYTAEDMVEDLGEEQMLVSFVNSRPWHWDGERPRQNFQWFGWQLFEDGTGILPNIRCIGNLPFDYCANGIELLETGAPPFEWEVSADKLIIDRTSIYANSLPDRCGEGQVCMLRNLQPVYIADNGLISVIESQLLETQLFTGWQDAPYALTYQIQPRLNYYIIQDLPSPDAEGNQIGQPVMMQVDPTAAQRTYSRALSPTRSVAARNPE